ncbi:hypothetical protein QUF70_11075 [Desulfobacterales bacterium HSG17]|nr:hypothetical protein [Desulfobacterales bacterium HSG17]
MFITEIRESVRTLSRPEKFGLLQFFVDELAHEEQNTLHRIDPKYQHGLWSQHNAFGAAEKLQKLLDNNKT